MAKHQNQPTGTRSQMLNSFEIELTYIFKSAIQYIKTVNSIRNKKDLKTIIDYIRSHAYSYLEKYSPSKQQLQTYLFKKILKKNQKQYNKKEIFHLINEVIFTLVDQKLLSDKYYSDVKARAFLRRGYSLNKIRYSLIKKGINEKICDISKNEEFFYKEINMVPCTR